MQQELNQMILQFLGLHPESAEFVARLVAQGDTETAINYLRSLSEELFAEAA